jgi:hypothetical protein
VQVMQLEQRGGYGTEAGYRALRSGGKGALGVSVLDSPRTGGTVASIMSVMAGPYSSTRAMNGESQESHDHTHACHQPD